MISINIITTTYSYMFMQQMALLRLFQPPYAAVWSEVKRDDMSQGVIQTQVSRVAPLKNAQPTEQQRHSMNSDIIRR